MNIKMLKMAFAGLVLGVCGFANAVPIISDFTGGGAYTGYFSDSDDVIGFSFTSDIDLTVTALGLFDDENDGVLNSSHMVGLWDMASQTLLGFASVSNSDTLTDGFFYSTLASAINLFAGIDYILGAVYNTNDGDMYVSGPSTITTNYISNTQGVYASAANLGFVFPTNVSTGNLGRIGPNLLAEPTTSVPAPSTLAIFALGLMGLAARRFRKQK